MAEHCAAVTCSNPPGGRATDRRPWNFLYNNEKTTQFSALGTALADATYAMLAAAGFAAFATLLATLAVPLGLIGGFFMLWLGWRGLRPTPAATAAEVGSRDVIPMVATTFLLTLANPTTVLSFAAIFAGLGIAAIGDGMNAAVVVAGVFLGLLA